VLPNRCFWCYRIAAFGAGAVPLSATVSFYYVDGCHWAAVIVRLLVDCYRCPLLLMLSNPCCWRYRVAAAFGATILLLLATSLSLLLWTFIWYVVCDGVCVYNTLFSNDISHVIFNRFCYLNLNTYYF